MGFQTISKKARFLKVSVYMSRMPLEAFRQRYEP